MKRFLLILLLLPVAGKAQEMHQDPLQYPKNTVYFELGGVGYIYSLNYQRDFSLLKHIDLAAGISLTPFRPQGNKEVGGYGRDIPSGALQLQIVYKLGKNELSIGGGGGYYIEYELYGGNNNTTESRRTINEYSFGEAGYGHIFGRRTYFGAFFVLAISDDFTTDLTPWAGVRIGYRFGR